MECDTHELDMDLSPEDENGKPQAPAYRAVFTTVHRAPCRAVAFSPDGKWAVSLLVVR